MSQLAPHLILRSDAGVSRTATILRSAGYAVTRISDDDAEQNACDSDVDGLVVELPTHAAIGAVRTIAARVGRNLATVVITQLVDVVRRAFPSAHAMRPSEVEDDLISAMDLALVSHQMQRSA